jgi:hypothetical protein
MNRPSRRRFLQGSLAAGSIFLPSPWASVWAQSEGATRLLRLPKVALVIGNCGYSRVPALKNPSNDAKGIAQALRDAGFEVTLRLDATRAQLLEAFEAHTRALAAKKCVGLFYFAGHAVQLAWRNYLLPVDAEVSKLDDIAAKCVDFGPFLDGITRSANPMNVFILDACRDNPFARDFRLNQVGLSQMDAPPASFLAYATAPGNSASDGEGENGLYTANLLREMKVRDAKIEDVFKRVRLNVRRESKGAQIPWESTSLEEDFYFLPPESLSKRSRDEEEQRYREDLGEYEKARLATSPAAVEGYLRRYPSGRFAELAQLRLDQLLVAEGEKRVEPAASEGNPNTKGSARADTAFKVGDTYRYRLRDHRTREDRVQTQRVTFVSDTEVHFNGGRIVTDLLGNSILTGNGRRFTPRQDVPLEYAVGKRWTSRFEVSGSGAGTVEMECRITARERVTVPAGTFDCFRLEGRGVNTNALSEQQNVSFKKWIAPGVRRPIAAEELQVSAYRHTVRTDERRELASYEQS